MFYHYTVCRARELGDLLLPDDSFAVGWSRAVAAAGSAADMDGGRSAAYLAELERRAFESAALLACEDAAPVMVMVAGPGDALGSGHVAELQPFARAALGDRNDMLWVCAALAARYRMVCASRVGRVDVGRHSRRCPLWDVVLDGERAYPEVAEMALAAWSAAELSRPDPAVLSVRGLSGGGRAYAIAESLADGFLFPAGYAAAVRRGDPA